MRIIAGQYRGMRLQAPSGNKTRPTTDRVREALFSSLHSRVGSLVGLRVLDAFAGSGALGFEALSRGASVCACERDRVAANVIRANRDRLAVDESRYRLYATDCLRMIGRGALGRPFDIVLLDPPYDDDTAIIGSWLGELAAVGSIAFGALLVWEQSTRAAEAPLFAPPFTELPAKTYGDTTLRFARFDLQDEENAA